MPAIFLVAGEESGDRLGAALIEALRARCGDDVTFAGVGGRAMAAQGMPSLFPIDELAIVGLGIAGKLPLILRRVRQAAAAAVAAADSRNSRRVTCRRMKAPYDLAIWRSGDLVIWRSSGDLRSGDVVIYLVIWGARSQAGRTQIAR